jgi:hypothetical protein
MASMRLCKSELAQSGVVLDKKQGWPFSGAYLHRRRPCTLISAMPFRVLSAKNCGSSCNFIFLGCHFCKNVPTVSLMQIIGPSTGLSPLK